MVLDERRLIRHLVTAVAVKVVVLALLWWVFVRDAQVPADAEQTAVHLGVTAPPSGVPQ